MEGKRKKASNDESCLKKTRIDHLKNEDRETLEESSPNMAAANQKNEAEYGGFPFGEATQRMLKEYGGAVCKEKYEGMSLNEIRISSAAIFEEWAVYLNFLFEYMREKSENLENEKNARQMAEEEVRELRRKINQLRDEAAAELQNTVDALSLEKKKLLALAEKSKAEAVAQAVESYKASQANELQAEAAELRNTVSALTLEMKELLVLAEKSKAKAGAQAVEVIQASQANELRAEAALAELRTTVAALTLEKKELLRLAEKSKEEAVAQAVEAYKASQTNELRAEAALELRAEAAALRNTVAALTLEKKELLVLFE